ncbi:MAG: iron chelate uptake ABC transporter family permease subunit, partial [Caulobacterales bacterium]
MRLILLLLALLALALVVSVSFGETALSLAQYRDAIAHPTSAPGEIIFGIRAPRACCAALVGAALGLAGAVMQGLLRNPLA